MTPDEREQHVRRMIAHGEKVQREFELNNAEFEAQCRSFWQFMQSADVRDLFKIEEKT